MASTYTDLGIELMVTGENAGTWGDKTNTNLNLIEQISGGYAIQTLNAAGTGANTQHIPFRFLPCMVAGLAYYLSLKIPEAAPKIQFLKQEYEEQWALAASEDREKATLSITPRQSYV